MSLQKPKNQEEENMEETEDGYKEVYIVVHGEVHKGANPQMTTNGFDQVTRWRRQLPGFPSVVVCGCGRRFADVAEALQLRTQRYTILAGCADSVHRENGSEKLSVILADGTKMPYDAASFTTATDLAPAVIPFLVALPHRAVICSGRPLLRSLNEQGWENNAQLGEAFKLTIREGKIVSLEPMVLKEGE